MNHRISRWVEVGSGRLLPGLAGWCCSAAVLGAYTNVSPLPEIDLASSMAQIRPAGEGVWVVPSLEGGTFWQLRWEEPSWSVAATHAVASWLPFPRLHPPWIHEVGGEGLVFQTRPGDPVPVPELVVLRPTDGVFEPVQQLGLAGWLEDPLIFSLSIHDVVALPDLLVVKAQVSRTGVGAQALAFCFVRQEAGWVVGPEFPLPGGFSWWPVYAERVGGTLRFGALSLSGSIYDMPLAYALQEWQLAGESWSNTSTTAFTHPEALAWSIEEVRGLLSPDRTSLVVFHRRDPLEFRRLGPGTLWNFQGSLDLPAGLSGDLYLASLGEGQALLREGAIANSYGAGSEVPLQRYHLLRQEAGAWALTGDMPSHRLLTEYYFQQVFYAFGEDRLTIFDTSPGERQARTYDLPDLQPRRFPWFAGSQTVETGVEWLPGLGFFHPLFSEDGRGLWLWHWNLGWLHAVGRQEEGFWFWCPYLGWTWCERRGFDQSAGRYWLYSWNRQDHVWSQPDTIDPRFFYSLRWGEWLTDLPAPWPDDGELAALAAQVSAELQEEGLTVEFNPATHLAVFTVQTVYDGAPATVRIEAPWQYVAGEDYPCHARFTLDLSWIQVTVGGETIGVSAGALWQEAGLRLPTLLTVDLLFQGPDRGVMLQSTDFNDGSREGPVREVFPAPTSR